MEIEYYYVYCEGILGVKTNRKDFKWMYGSVAPVVTEDEYKKCKIKFNVIVKSEQELESVDSNCEHFQAYKWDGLNKILSCKRKIFTNFEIGYNIKICENTIYAEIGRNYYKYIKNRFMNLHGVYYLLSDLANIILLKNGLLTIYGSAIYNHSKQRCILNFAPPNTGKTLTATKLCESNEYSLIGEDIVISDGQMVYSCPWTTSYRKVNNSKADSANSFSRKNKNVIMHFCERSVITDCTILSIGKELLDKDKERILKKSSTLIEYLFGGYSTPIVNLLRYFDDDFDYPWQQYSRKILRDIINNSNAYHIQSLNNLDFHIVINHIIKGECI